MFHALGITACFVLHISPLALCVAKVIMCVSHNERDVMATTYIIRL